MIKFFGREINVQYNLFFFLLPGLFAIFKAGFDWLSCRLSFFIFGLHCSNGFFRVIQPTFFWAFFKKQQESYEKRLDLDNVAGLCVAALSVDNLGWITPRPDWLKTQKLFWMQLVFFIGLVGALYVDNKKKEKGPEDISGLSARIWFWLIFIFAILLRFHKISTPEGSWGYDEVSGILETRGVHDFQEYSQGYYIGYLQKPLFCYLLLFLWHWIPSATDILVMRLGSIISDLVTVWLLYLTAKEVGGKRAGLIAAAIAAISKPELIISAMGMGSAIVPLSVLLPLLIALRLFKKPDLKHFIQLGLSLALGIYDNDYVRIEVIFFIVAIVIWLLSKKENRKLNGFVGRVIFLNAITYAAYFFYTCVGFKQNLGFNQLFSERPKECFEFLFCVFLLLVIVRVILGSKSEAIEKNKNWINALICFWICALLDYPMVPTSWDRLSSMVDSNPSILHFFVSFIQNLNEAVQLLFWWGTSPANMGILGDSFFSFGEVVLIFLGLAFLFVKPNWSKVFIFLVAFVGVLPHVIVGATHNSRLITAIGPFILIGALGFNDLLGKTVILYKSPWVYRSLLIFLVTFGGWCAWTNYYRVFTCWFDTQILYVVGASDIVAEESSKGSRVYFGDDDIICGETTVLCEALSVHKLFPVNVIYRHPGDKPQDMVIILHSFVFETDKKIIAEIKKYFPSVTWDRKYENEYCKIPGKLLSDKKQKMFVFVDEPKDQWKREFTSNLCGLIFGYVEYEDRAVHVDDPIDPVYAKSYADSLGQRILTVRFSATIHIAREGDYFIHYKAINTSWLKVDGKKVADLTFFKLNNKDNDPIYWAPQKEGDERIHLTKGDHPVEMVTCFRRTDKLPEFWLRPVGSASPGVSLWSSFDF